MRSYTQMVVQCAAVQRAAAQCTTILKWLFNVQLFNAQLFKAQAVQCVAILQWLFNAQLFNAQLGWVRSSILKYQVDNRCNFTDRMEKVGQIEIGKLMTKMT